MTDAPREPGAFAAATRAREAQLADRLAASVAADEEFEAILRDAAHGTRSSRRRLDAIEAEIRQAAATWPSLDTPAGSRQFQRFLVAKTREISRVVDDATRDSAQQSDLLRTLTDRYRQNAVLPEGRSTNP